MPSEEYIKKYGNKKKSIVRTSEEIHKPLSLPAKHKVPVELQEKVDVSKVKNAITISHHGLLELKSNIVWKFIRGENG